jgi:serine phosphatase RsbU (regulator of sigma subunit)/pSer/pThr/pTyr-binding forkhead associated (FHA) protein
MPPPESSASPQRRPTLLVANPSGNRTKVVLEPVPFSIGRHPENNLVLRDTRISRNHARITSQNGQFLLEDLKSRHGVYVNGERVERRNLRSSDRIDFGFQDSYRITFSLDEGDLSRILDQIQPAAAAPSNLGKLRSLVEVARALQSSLSIDDVLTAVVDAALAVTGTERGFLLLRDKEDLDVKVARERGGMPLSNADLKVPTSLIQRALRQRRELLSMSFDPAEEQGVRPNTTIASLELRSVVCVPLVRVRAGGAEETMVSSLDDTVGLLYMDSRETHADLSAGNRELLQTLALEASTILENARLLEEERAKQRIEEELDIARQIQTSLLPTQLPSSGWFRAAGSSIASHQVGGDYFDVREISPNAWSVVVADVSGKGVSSAILASFLQGAFLLASDSADQIAPMMGRMNRYLLERTKGERYATVFYGILERSGACHWSNAGHCAPMIVHAGGGVTNLATTGLPIGMIDGAQYGVEEIRLVAGDKIVIYSDGLTEAPDFDDRFFGSAGLCAVLESHAGETCAAIHAELLKAVEAHTQGTVLPDDVTVVVIEYAP